MSFLNQLKSVLESLDNKSRYFCSNKIAKLMYCLGIFPDFNETISRPYSKNHHIIFEKFLKILRFGKTKFITIEILIILLLVIKGEEVTEKRETEADINIREFIETKQKELDNYLHLNEIHNKTQELLKIPLKRVAFDQIFLIFSECFTDEKITNKAENDKKLIKNSQLKYQGKLKNFLNPNYSFSNKPKIRADKHGSMTLNYSKVNDKFKSNNSINRKITNSDFLKKKLKFRSIKPLKTAKGMKKNSIGLSASIRENSTRSKRQASKSKKNLKNKKISLAAKKSTSPNIAIKKFKPHPSLTSRSRNKKSPAMLEKIHRKSSSKFSIRTKLQTKLEKGTERVRQIKQKLKRLDITKYRSTVIQEKKRSKSLKETTMSMVTINFNIPDAYHEYDESLDEIISGRQKSIISEKKQICVENKNNDTQSESESSSISQIYQNDQEEDSVLRSSFYAECSPEEIAKNIMPPVGHIEGFDEGFYGEDDETLEAVKGEGDGEKHTFVEKENKLNKILKRVSLSMGNILLS